MKSTTSTRSAFLAFAGSLATLSLVLGFAACKSKDAGKQPLSMVITFTSGDAKVVHEGKDIPASIGLIVYEKDIIRTENGSVDLQTRTGSAVRVREMTTLTVARIAGQDGGETRLSMDHGGLLANVKKASASENFNVATPTAIAGVRGTSFAVEYDQFAQSSNVKVLDGKVAMSPRIAALDNVTAEQIQKDPALQKMADVQKKEVVLDEKTEGRLNPALEKQVLAVNEKTASAPGGNLETLRKDLDQAAANLERQSSQPVVDKQEAKITEQDVVEKETLVVVSPDLLQKLGDGKTDEGALRELKQNRQQKQEAILKKIEESAQKVDLKDERQIQQHYNKLELIILRDGSKITGAVIAQTGDVLVIHTPQGVRRIPKSEVESQEFR